MDFNPQPDFPISFTHSQYKPTAERFIYVPQEFQEQAFQTLRTDRFQDNFDANQRSQSAEPAWATSTFGKKDDYYFNNKNLPKSNHRENERPHFEGTGNFSIDNSKLTNELNQELRDTIKAEAGGFAEWDTVKKDKKKTNLKVVTTTASQRKPFTVPNSHTKREISPKPAPGGYCRSPRRELKQTTDVKFLIERNETRESEPKETRESEKRSPRSTIKNEALYYPHALLERKEKEKETRLSQFNEIINTEQHEDLKQNRNIDRKMEREIGSLTRQNKLKDIKIEELEKQVDELLSGVHAERTRFIGYLEIAKKEFLENDIHIITLRQSLHTLFENNTRIIDISRLNDRGHQFIDLGQEIEKNKAIWAKINIEMDKMTEHARVSEDRTRKLWETATKNPNELMMNKQGSIDNNVAKSRESFEVQKAKEDLLVYIDALDMEEKTVKRLTEQVQEMEELLNRYLRSENGQLNSGLKNTARKLIELQSRLEKSNSEKEDVERQVTILSRENEDLQSELKMLEKEKERWSSYEKGLREAKAELRKSESKNEILAETNTKNEVIINRLKSLVDDLTAARKQQGFVDRTPVVDYVKKSETSLLSTAPQERLYETVPTKQIFETKFTSNLGPDALSYKSPPLYTAVDDLADRKLSGTSNNVYDPHVESLLGQLNTTYEDPLLKNVSYSRDASGSESRLRYVDPPSLEKPSTFLNANMRHAESIPVSAQYSQDQIQIPFESKSNKLDLYTVDLSTFGLQGGNTYKYGP